jgi:TPR repeat protein
MKDLIEPVRTAMRMARQQERDEFRAHVAGARAGNAADMYSVAHAFASGLGTAPDVDRQITWLERAAEAGDDRAPHNLGCAFDEAGDFERAHTRYRRAAALGDAAAMANLGWMKERGHGGEPDEAAAIEWYQRGADLEDPQCRYNLARLLLRRDPVSNAYPGHTSSPMTTLASTSIWKELTSILSAPA